MLKQIVVKCLAQVYNLMLTVYIRQLVRMQPRKETHSLSQTAARLLMLIHSSFLSAPLSHFKINSLFWLIIFGLAIS